MRIDVVAAFEQYDRVALPVELISNRYGTEDVVLAHRSQDEALSTVTQTPRIAGWRLTGDLQGEVRQLLRRQPQRTGAEVAARAAIGVRIFQHVREGRH